MGPTDLTFASYSFDLIICSDVLEHIKEDERAFYHLGRVIKKSGTLLITFPYDSKKTGRRINSIITSNLDTRNQKIEG
jgi:2-polyprenyl-3-methyl-5-hydroxy-6-metoxy-1,4-benzoquinol methylase